MKTYDQGYKDGVVSVCSDLIKIMDRNISAIELEDQLQALADISGETIKRVWDSEATKEQYRSLKSDLKKIKEKHSK